MSTAADDIGLAAAAPVDCFHCGEPVPAGAPFAAELEGRTHTLCCAGCEAAVNLIRDAGLEGYYRFRESRQAPTPPPPGDMARYEVYDRPAMLAAVSAVDPEGLREADVLLDGVRCAACTWLIEATLMQLPGVAEAQVALATGRLNLRWDPARVELSRLLAQLGALGYAPQPVQADTVIESQARQRRTMLKRLFVAGVGMMQVMTFAAAVYVGLPRGMEEQFHQFFRLVSMLVATPVVLYSAFPFFHGAWRALRNGALTMDVPVSIAIGGAWAASVVFVFIGHGEVWFDSVTMFTFFLLIGRYLEMQARHRSGDVADALARLTPQSARRIDAEGIETRIGAVELGVGDIVRVDAGEPFPADGEIVAGRTRVDESLVTGESRPLARGVGGAVIAGSVNTGQRVDVRVTRIGGDTLLSGIARMLRRARGHRPPSVLAADRVARWFVFGTLVVASTVFTVWWQFEPARAFEITLAVLVVTCPCALSLAMPTALTSGTGRAAREGLLVTRAGTLERLARADVVVLDKTGTLTAGQARLRGVTVFGAGDEHDALAVAAALEAGSTHPLAAAFDGDDVRAAEDLVVYPGEGLEGVVNGRRWRIGRRGFVGGLCANASAGRQPNADDAGAGGVEDVDADAGTDTGQADADATGDDSGFALGRLWLGDVSGVVAVFDVDDALRPDAPGLVARLSALGLDCVLASGDHPDAVARVARQLGIGRWHAAMSPADKLALVRELQAAGHRVVMLGDGINDAPVLAGADVSVAMGAGTSLAQHSADSVLLTDSLDAFADGISTARRTLRGIRQNLAWALGYNLTALPLAALGLVPPWAAAIGMSASSLLVVLNALRIGREGPSAGGREASSVSEVQARAEEAVT